MSQAENKVVYFYGTTAKKTKKTKIRRVCVAGILEDRTKSIIIGVAQCSHKDRFIKSKGRAIAQGRANSNNPFDVLEMPSTAPINYFISEAKRIINNL